MNVAIIGASGETGQSIITALLKSAHPWSITAFVREASIEKPEVQRLKKEGIEVTSIDLEASHDELVQKLKSQDIVISCVIPVETKPQIALADACKAANVKRFVPSAFGPATPPEGVLILKDIKQKVLNYIQKIYLPYTVIDVGWWYQNTAPRLESGKIDYAVRFPVTHIAGDGNFPSALTDLRDVGTYVERIIADSRTLNKLVFVYNEVLTQEQVWSTLEQASGEKIPRNYIAAEELNKGIENAKTAHEKEPSVATFLGLTTSQYFTSIWLRGDNLPESATYLGYVNGKELYPDVKYTTFAEYAKELMAGEGKRVYANKTFPFEKK